METLYSCSSTLLSFSPLPGLLFHPFPELQRPVHSGKRSPKAVRVRLHQIQLTPSPCGLPNLLQNPLHCQHSPRSLLSQQRNHDHAVPINDTISQILPFFFLQLFRIFLVKGFYTSGMTSWGPSPKNKNFHWLVQLLKVIEQASVQI